MYFLKKDYRRYTFFFAYYACEYYKANKTFME